MTSVGGDPIQRAYSWVRRGRRPTLGRTSFGRGEFKPSTYLLVRLGHGGTSEPHSGGRDHALGCYSDLGKLVLGFMITS